MEATKENVLRAVLAKTIQESLSSSHSNDSMLFFTAMLFHTPMVYNGAVPTACTDGRKIMFGDWFFNIPFEQKKFVVFHELCHIAMLHIPRGEGRNLKKWNVATDLRINRDLKEAGFKQPEYTLCLDNCPGFKDFPKDASAETYYNLLTDDMVNKFGQGVGDFEKADSDSYEEIEGEAKIRVSAAKAQCNNRGKLPGELGRLIDEAIQPKVDWYSALIEFANAFAKDDYSWRHPNKRFVYRNLYLPSMRSEELGEAIFVIDTSGSIGDEQLKLFAGAIQDVNRLFKCKTTIVYHDYSVAGEDNFEKGEFDYKMMKPKGGGGTSHVPVFNYIKEKEDTPLFVVCLTDLYTEFPNEPEFPVIWARTPESRVEDVPFGKLIRM